MISILRPRLRLTDIYFPLQQQRLAEFPIPPPCKSGGLLQHYPYQSHSPMILSTLVDSRRHSLTVALLFLRLLHNRILVLTSILEFRRRQLGGSRVPLLLMAIIPVRMTRPPFRVTLSFSGVRRSLVGIVRLSTSVAFEVRMSLRMMMMLLLLTHSFTTMKKLYCDGGMRNTGRYAYPIVVFTTLLHSVVFRRRGVSHGCNGDIDFDGRVALWEIVCIRAAWLIYGVDALRRYLEGRTGMVEGWCRHQCRHRFIHYVVMAIHDR